MAASFQHYLPTIADSGKPIILVAAEEYFPGGGPKLAIGKFWGVKFFKEDHKILRLVEYNHKHVFTYWNKA